MGGTVRDLSVHWASPNASHKEKHEQFTPNLGREPSSARSLALMNFGDFDWQDTRTKSIYICHDLTPKDFSPLMKSLNIKVSYIFRMLILIL